MTKHKRKQDIELHRIRIQRKVCNYVPPSIEAMYDIGVGPKNEWEIIHSHFERIKMFGCEPDPRNYEWLKNVFPGTLWNIAIASNRRRSIELTQYNRRGMTSLFNRHENSIGTCSASCWTLDYFDKKCGEPNSILLWMDIEGMELEALRSGERLLRSGRVITINLEARTTPLAEGWTTENELSNYLEPLGYKPAVHYNNQKTHCDVIYTKKCEKP